MLRPVKSLIPLGTNGFFPSYGRHTTSFMLTLGTHAILLDAGTGVARLAEPDVRSQLTAIESLDVVLSHYHLDHVMGLFYLPAVWPGRPIRLWGPGPPFVDANPREALSQLLRPPFVGKTLDDLADIVEVGVLDQAETYMGDCAVRIWRQLHPGGSIGLRFGDALAFMTDRGTDAALIPEVRHVRLLAHELWMTDEEADDSPEHRLVHSCLGDVAAFAQRAEVGAIMPIHHHPSRSGGAVKELCATLERVSGLPVIMPIEGQAYPLAD